VFLFGTAPSERTDEHERNSGGYVNRTASDDLVSAAGHSAGIRACDIGREFHQAQRRVCQSGVLPRGRTERALHDAGLRVEPVAVDLCPLMTFRPTFPRLRAFWTRKAM